MYPCHNKTRTRRYRRRLRCTHEKSWMTVQCALMQNNEQSRRLSTCNQCHSHTAYIHRHKAKQMARCESVRYDVMAVNQSITQRYGTTPGYHTGEGERGFCTIINTGANALSQQARFLHSFVDGGVGEM